MRDAEQSSSDQSDRERADAPAETGHPARWIDFERATGDWGGHRSRLEESGITIESTLIAEYFGIVDGGARSRSTTRLLYDLNVTLDLERMFDIRGASVFADAYWIDGDSLSADAGDFQGASNIEADDRFQLAELWYEQLHFDAFSSTDLVEWTKHERVLTNEMLGGPRGPCGRRRSWSTTGDTGSSSAPTTSRATSSRGASEWR